jgi:hypothetical protein
MSFPVSTAVRDAFLGSHEMDLRVTVIRGSENLGDIKVIEADVSASYGTQGGRDASITVDKNLISGGFLSPLTDQVIIRTGIPGIVEVPLFTGRVDEHSALSTGQVRIQLLSRGGEAIRAAFEQPWAAGPAGTLASAEMVRILQNIDPTWGVDVSDANTSVIPAGLVWEQDPGQALDQLAQGASLIWQPDRSGGFVIYTNPWTLGSLIGGNPVVTLVDGEDGCLVSVEANTSRIGVFNSVTVVTERVNNTPPVRVTAKDVSPTSPTRWGGLFGKQNLVVKNQTPEVFADSAALAQRILRQSLALQRSFAITVPDMPLLDPGDVFTLWYENVVYSLVAESIDYSCQADQPTRISARELMTETVIELT